MAILEGAGSVLESGLFPNFSLNIPDLYERIRINKYF